MTHSDIIRAAGLREDQIAGGSLWVHSPIDGTRIAGVTPATAADTAGAIHLAQAAFRTWRLVPAPRRGELVRLIGEELRAAKSELAALVTLEAGKITQEALGEVQEMIDICDFAVGQSRQLYGLTIASERAGHRVLEVWHPMGPCAIITAFNFPVAVWAWNAALALVCGNPVIWKPSEKTPLCALATLAIVGRALARFGDAPEGLVQVLPGGPEIGAALAASNGVAIVSATGSTRMGAEVGAKVFARWGRPILELGGNNAMIVAPSADLGMALRAIVFSAVGTAGQRCTSLRRLIVHHSIRDQLTMRLKQIWEDLVVGDPRAPETLVGPLIDAGARARMLECLDQARREGGTVHGGTPVAGPGSGVYMRPALVEMPGQTPVMRRETFAPVLYIIGYETLEEAIGLQNDVPQGLSSSLFTMNMREAGAFLGHAGSDCGMANVNIGPSGAEIGGAFGGEKESGSGRESGSDAWKGYMRRQTNTINYSADMPLAQGVRFEI